MGGRGLGARLLVERFELAAELLDGLPCSGVPADCTLAALEDLVSHGVGDLEEGVSEDVAWRAASSQAGDSCSSRLLWNLSWYLRRRASTSSSIISAPHFLRSCIYLI